ncbi:MAG: haloacid dehalogenase [Anaerolineaceae bacterium]|nr:haloacid dehalogenase [Anaerolineaceae bacterium]
MENLTAIADKIRQDLDARTQARDQALVQARTLTRHCAHAIRAIHRNENELAQEHLTEARSIVAQLGNDLRSFPDLFYAGYTQDAIKEFVEASNTCALIQNQPLLTPEQLEVESATYLNGLAEVTGELRRRCLDILRQGYSSEAERLLACMDEIYALLVTMDYPDAVTNGLRRQTDLVRGITERTRGDLTISLREQQLQDSLDRFISRLPGLTTPEPTTDGDHAHDSGV